jgi:carbonyl reductase 1
MRVTDALLPALRRAESGGRIVNVCSQAGRLSQVSPELQSQFQDPAATRGSLSKLMDQFVEDVRAGRYKEAGWSSSMYGVSKLGEIALTYVYARELLPEGVAVNAVCPGYCSTSMSSYRGSRPASKGAETPVWLATREGKTADVTGGFWYDMALVSW